MSVYVGYTADNNTNKQSVHAINGICENLFALVIKEETFKYSATTTLF